MVKIVPCLRLDPMLWTWLTLAEEDYRRRSGDPCAPGFQLLKAVRQLHDAAPVRLWLASKDGHVVGYAVTEVLETWRGRVAFVAQAYLADEARSLGVPGRAMQVFEEWAARHGCRGVEFSSFRPVAAYARLLGRFGYRQTSAAFAKELPHG